MIGFLFMGAGVVMVIYAIYEAHAADKGVGGTKYKRVAHSLGEVLKQQRKNHLKKSAALDFVPIS